MRATLIHGERDIRVEDVKDPRILAPTDTLVQVTASCVCGSDLWHYRGVVPTREPRRIGHQVVGVVEEVGADVTTLRPGQFVIAPFALSDGTCPHCVAGVQTSCDRGTWWGAKDRDGLPVDGGQGQYVRVALADGTLVATPEVPDDAMVPDLLTLSDVMGTGHHAALGGRVRRGSTVVVVGDGAVGQCAVLECVGTKNSMQQALDSTRPGGRVGYVGVPNGGAELPIRQMFGANIGVGGGVAPVRAYLPELLEDVLAGTLSPGLVFDGEFPLEQTADAYAAMDERRVIKALLRP